MEKRISLFKGGITNINPSRVIDLKSTYELVLSDKYKIETDKLRAETNEKLKSKLKSSLDYVTFSGTFSTRKVAGLIEHSGLICIDIDKLNDIESIRNVIYKDEFLRMAFISPSGGGLKLVFEIDSNDNELAWSQIAEYLKVKYSIEADKSGKDVSRACFLCHDEKAYLNEKSEVFEIICKKPNGFIVERKSDFERAKKVVERIQAAKLDITNDYADWLNIGFALATFGEDGRQLFHDLSSQNSKYNMKDSDQKFDDLLAKGKFNSPAFFFKKAKEHGITITKEDVSQAESHIVKNDDFFSNEMVRYDLQNFKIAVKSGKGEVTIAKGFLLYIKYQTIDEQGNYTWVLEIIKPESDPFYIEVSNDSFYDIKELERVFGTKRLSLNVKSDQLQKLKEFLFNCTIIPNAYKVLRYGLHSDSELYFFSNCAITKSGEILYPDNLGMLKFKEYYFSLPQINKNQISPFGYIENNVKFNDWYLLFSKAQREEITFLATSFFLFSLFRDIGIKSNSFSPMLFIYGIAGTAKSTVYIHLNYLFGQNGKEMGVNLKGRNSEAGFNAKSEQRSNGLLFADEYMPNHPLTPALQGFYDNKGYSKMNMNSNSHLDTIDLTPKCTIGMSSNFLPALPEDEPFFSRLVLLINNNRDRTEKQKNAFRELQMLQESGITNVLREIWTHRDLVKKEYKSAYQKIKSALEAHFKSHNIGNPRYIYNLAQILAVPYILSIHGKINMCEASEPNDILSDFIRRSEKSILDSDNIVKEKTPLNEFFEFMQDQFDRGFLLEGAHYRFDGQDITINLNRLHKKFEFEFRKQNRFEVQAPSMQMLQDEILSLVGLDSNNDLVKDNFFRKMRFKDELQDSKIDFARNSFKINYLTIQKTFGIQLK
jgi:VirE N-terminal domain/Primase C terminal 2 (PriCT-2)